MKKTHRIIIIMVISLVALAFIGRAAILVSREHSLLVLFPVLSVPNQVPSDFFLRARRGPMHLSWNPTKEFKITPSKDAQQFIARWSRITYVQNEPRPKTTSLGECQLKTREVLPIYQEVVSQRFFCLRDNYRNKNIVDGNWFSLTVRFNGKEKRVYLSNKSHPRIDAIMKKVNEIRHGRNRLSNQSPQEKR